MAEENAPVIPTEAKENKEAPSQDPIKQELEKEQKKVSYSDKEKAIFNLRRHAERVKELGEDPKSVLGGEEEPKDEVPEWYRKEKAKETQKNALQLADSVADENERALVKQYLQTRINPSGDPESDFRLAYSAVVSLKNKEIAEEVSRRAVPKTTASGGSQPPKYEEQFTPTAEEERLMRKPYNISKEKIIAARRKEAEKK